MGRHKKVPCRKCLRIMRSDKLKIHMKQHEKVDIWACYNCNRWETDDRCHICNAPFTEQDELHVKDEVKDPELLEDSIEVLKIYKLLQRMKNK